MKQTQRHDAIIELVKKQGYVGTEELVEQFAVSPQTIRRDLNDLAERKMILRHHGGAALPSSSVNTSWHDRKATQTAEKSVSPGGWPARSRTGRRCLLISAPRRKRWRTPCSITTICGL